MPGYWIGLCSWFVVRAPLKRMVQQGNRAALKCLRLRTSSIPDQPIMALKAPKPMDSPGRSLAAKGYAANGATAPQEAATAAEKVSCTKSRVAGFWIWHGDPQDFTIRPSNSSEFGFGFSWAVCMARIRHVESCRPGPKLNALDSKLSPNNPKLKPKILRHKLCT